MTDLNRKMIEAAKVFEQQAREWTPRELVDLDIETRRELAFALNDVWVHASAILCATAGMLPSELGAFLTDDGYPVGMRDVL